LVRGYLDRDCVVDREAFSEDLLTMKTHCRQRLLCRCVSTAERAFILAMAVCVLALVSIVPATAATARVPDWVPIYPGGKVSAVDTRQAGIETYTKFQLDTSADCYKVAVWYVEQLRRAGYSIGNPTTPLPGHCTAGFRADGPGRTRSLWMTGGGASGGPSSFEMQAVVRDLPGGPVAGSGAIPAWVPQYPGGTPANLVARQAGGERSANFNFVTADDARKVIDWYERQLKAAKFTIVTSTVFDANTARLTAQDATGRSILNLRMEPTGGRKVVAIEARDAGR
jgi:hypothetical protein